MNYNKEKYKRKNNSLKKEDLEMFIQGLKPDDIDSVKFDEDIEKLFFNIGCNITISNKKDVSAELLKKITKKYLTEKNNKERQRIDCHKAINVLKEIVNTKDKYSKELFDILNKSFTTEKEIIINKYLSSNKNVLFACQEVTVKEEIRGLILNELHDFFFTEPLNFKTGIFYSNFCVNNNLEKDVRFELIDEKELINEKWDKLYKKIFKYDNSCDEKFPTGYISECKCFYNDTNIRVINFHRPLSGVGRNRFLPFTLFLIEYMRDLLNCDKNQVIILIGDFNGDTKDELFTTLCSCSFGMEEVLDNTDLDKDYQCTHFNDKKQNGKKLDHVFVSKNISAKFDYSLKYDHSVNLFHPKNSEKKSMFTDHSAVLLSLQPNK